jgi:hypothetical protein
VHKSTKNQTKTLTKLTAKIHSSGSIPCKHFRMPHIKYMQHQHEFSRYVFIPCLSVYLWAISVSVSSSVNNVLDRRWKKAIMISFVTQSWDLSGRTKKTIKIPSGQQASRQRFKPVTTGIHAKGLFGDTSSLLHQQMHYIKCTQKMSSVTATCFGTLCANFRERD